MSQTTERAGIPKNGISGIPSTRPNASAVSVAGQLTSLINTALIQSNGSGGTGVSVTGSLASMSNSGQIQAASADGVGLSVAGNTGTLSNIAGGLVSGGAFGLAVGGTVAALSNNGAVTGNTGLFVASTGSVDTIGNGLGGTIAHTGSVAGNGLWIQGTVNAVNNSGGVIRTDSAGLAGILVDTQNLGAINNSGTILSSNGPAIAYAAGASVTGVISNTGTNGLIQGGPADGSGIAIDTSLATAAQTISTSGSIVGAILQGHGADVLNVQGGGIKGNIVGQDGANGTVNFATGSGNTFTTAGNIGGVDFVNVLSGTLAVAAGNSITATNANAVGVNMLGAGSGLSNSGLITAGEIGVSIVGGPGAFAIDQVVNNAAGTISSGSVGIAIGDPFGGPTAAYVNTVSNSGQVLGPDAGVYINGQAGTITNQAGGLILSNGGGAQGLVMQAGTVSLIQNAGMISGTNGSFGGAFGVGIASGTVDRLVNTGTIYGDSFGVGAAFGGTIGTVDNSGLINSLQNGVSLYSDGTITALLNRQGGVISGNFDGAEIDGNLTLLSNAGTITGDTGVLVNTTQFGTLTNSGAITGNNTGIFYTPGASISGGITNTATGLIQGGPSDGSGIAIDAGLATAAQTINTAGTIIGAIMQGQGTDLLHVTGGSITGSIVGQTGFGGSVNFDLGTNGTFATGGNIGGVDNLSLTSGALTISSGNTVAISTADSSGIVLFGHNLTLTNKGVIASTTDAGSSVFVGPMADGVALYNTQGAVISAAGSVSSAIRVFGNATTIDNAGTIASTGKDSATGIDVFGVVGTITNQSTGLIQASNAGTLATAIEIQLGATVAAIANAGQILAPLNTNGFGINVDGAVGAITNRSGGTISAGYNAINVSATGSVTSITNSGLISGATSGGDGIEIAGIAGTITNNAGGVIAADVQFGDGIYIDGGATVGAIANSGSISSNAAGAGAAIYVGGVLTSLTNNAGGVIKSTNAAIEIDTTSLGTIGNYGTISSSGAAAILYDSKASVSGSINNYATSGLIQGGTVGGTIIAIDARLATGPQTINTAGRIVGDVLQGTGADTLNVLGGTITGDIIGQANAGGTVNFNLGNGNTFATAGNISQVDLNEVTSGTLLVSAGNTITASTPNNAGLHLAGNGTGLINNGTIQSVAQFGVVTDAGVTAGSIVNNASGVISGGAGIFANAITSISNSGLITGAAQGIYAAGAVGTITNNAGGTIQGVVANAQAISVSGGTVTTVINNGLIAATAAGGAGILENSTGNAGASIGLINNTGTINGGGQGVIAYRGLIGTITNSGLIQSVSGVGIQTNAIGSITTVSNSGVIRGLSAGIRSDGSIGSITNLTGGSILATGPSGSGILINGSVGTITNQAGALIDPPPAPGQASYGINVASGGSLGQVGNAGSIVGSADGILVAGSAGTITNTGPGGVITATGTNGAGIATAGGSITTITNSGLISDTNTGGDGIIVNVGSIGLISNTGTILGTDAGVYASVGSIGTVSNSGSIGSSANNGVRVGSTGTIASLINNAGGTISGAVAGVSVAGIVGAASNSGLISAPTGTGLFVTGAIGNGTTTGFTNTGTIQGGPSNGSGTAINDQGASGAERIDTSGVIIGAVLQSGKADLLHVTGGSITGNVVGQSGAGGTVNFDLGAGNTFTTAGNIAQVDTVTVTTGTLAVASGNTITASSANAVGVTLAGAGTGLTNSGTINGGTGAGVNVTGSVVSFVTNTATGVIKGSTQGIAVLNNLAAINNLGQISGGGQGVYVGANGVAGSVTNSGTISGTGTGGDGIQVAGGRITGTIANSGLIQGSGTGTDAGILLSGGSIAVINNSGTVTGAANGVWDNAGSITSLFNTGLIQATGSAGAGVNIGSGATIGTVTNNGPANNGSLGVGTIQATGQNGVGLLVAGTTGALNNYGLIQETATGGTAISVTSTLSSITNFNGAVIQATGTNGVGISGSVGTITNNAGGAILATGTNGVAIKTGNEVLISNAGIINGSGANGVGIYAQSGTVGTISNAAGGTITGAANGIASQFGQVGTVSNNGLISAGVAAISNQATLGFGLISNAATISGGIVNSSVGGNIATIGTISNAGLLTAAGNAIYTNGTITTVANTGTITSAAGDATVLVTATSNTPSGSGFIGTLTNTGGLIQDTGIGSAISGSIGTITNDATGVIRASIGAGIQTGNNTLVSNSGLISSTSGAGIAAASGTTVTAITNLASGTITGGGSGVQSGFGHIGTLTNSGLISGGTYGVLNYANNGIGTLVNNAGATITGVQFAIQNGVADSAIIPTMGSIANAGTLSSAGEAIYTNGTITTLSNTGLITGATGVDVANANGVGLIGTLSNTTGTIKATGSAGHAINVSGLITLLSNGGTILATNAGNGINISGGSIGAINNTGLITQAGAAGSGISNSNGTIGVLTNGGTISGASAGVTNAGGTITTLTNNGTVTSIGTGVDSSAGGAIGTLSNTGLVSGTAAGVAQSAGTIASLSNSGTIQGAVGIRATSGGVITTLTNSNLIQSTGSGSAITSDSKSVINTIANNKGGLILSPSGTAIQVAPAIATAITNAAGATVQGGAANGSGTAIDGSGGAGAMTLTNTGTIIGGVKQGHGADTFNLSGGVFTGNVTGQSNAGGTVNLALASATLGGTDTFTNVDNVNLTSGLLTLTSAGNVITGAKAFNISNGATTALDSTSIVGAVTTTNSGIVSVGTNTATLKGSYVQTSTGSLNITVAGNLVNGTNVNTWGGLNLTNNGTAAVNGGTVALHFTGLTTFTPPMTIITSTVGASAANGVTITDDSPNPFYNMPSLVVSGTNLNIAFATPTPSQVLPYAYTFLGGTPTALTPYSISAKDAYAARLASLNLPTFGKMITMLSQSTPAQIDSYEKQAAPWTIANALSVFGNGMIANDGLTTSVEGRLIAARATAGMAAGDEAGRGFTAWAQPFGASIQQGAKDGFGGFNAASYGAALGADTMVRPDLRLGVGFSIANTDIRYSGATSGNTDNVLNIQLGAYGTWFSDGFFVDGNIAGGYNSFTSKQNITGLGQQSANHSGEQFTMKIGAGYEARIEGAVITPSISFQEMHMNFGSYAMAGGSGPTANINSQSVDLQQGKIGVRLAYPIQGDEGWKFTPEVHLNYVHNFNTTGVTTTGTFAGGLPFNVFAPARDAEVVNVGAGLTIAQDGPFALSGVYDYSGGETAHIHSFFLRVKSDF